MTVDFFIFFSHWDDIQMKRSVPETMTEKVQVDLTEYLYGQ